MTRLIVRLASQRDRELAKRAIDRAPEGYVADIHEQRRSDEQNRALWPRLAEIQKQRPTHNNVAMNPELWKVVFMDALGDEMRMMPKLNGDGFFPMGHSSSALTKSQFADLLTLIDAWCAQEGVALKHFEVAA